MVDQRANAQAVEAIMEDLRNHADFPLPERITWADGAEGQVEELEIEEWPEEQSEEVVEVSGAESENETVALSKGEGELPAAVVEAIDAAEAKPTPPAPGGAQKTSAADGPEGDDRLAELATKFNEILVYLERIKPSENLPFRYIQADAWDDFGAAGLGGVAGGDVHSVPPIIVDQVPDGIVISCTAKHGRAEGLLAGGGKQVKFGKLKTAWSSGNTVTLNPCKNIDGDEPDTTREIVCQIRMPSGAEDMESFDADVGDVLSYWPLTSTTGILLANPGRDLPIDGAQYHVLQKNSANLYDFVIGEVRATAAE